MSFGKGPKQTAIGAIASALFAMAASCGLNELAGGVPATVECNSCHGNEENDAPPKALKREAGDIPVRVGAHQSHLTDGELRRAIECADCHKVPSTMEQEGHMDPAPAEVRFSGLGVAAGASPVWAPESASCSGVYCHGSTLSGGTNTSPDWRDVDGDQVVCGSCHGIGPPAPHTVDKRCHSCHEDTVDDEAKIIVDGGKHINGVLDVSADLESCNNCHGSEVNDAPPVDTLGQSDPKLVTVGAHQSHMVGGGWHREVECEDCHKVPESAGDGHNDGFPAEMTWSALASTDQAAPSFDRYAATCSGVYCHGATLEPGGSVTEPAWTSTDGSQAQCGTCHGLPPGGTHTSEEECVCCHSTVDEDQNIILPLRHIDGTVDLEESHPDGYDDSLAHGMDAKLQKDDCRKCHGAGLTGGCAEVSCDDCHAAGWRTNCTYCHGGVDNQTGAPPEDIRNEIGATFPGVGSHTEHVTGTTHKQYDCTECHKLPADVLTSGHMFDDTPDEGEVTFSAGLSSGGLYTKPACTDIYCHGTGLKNGSVSNFTGSIETCDSCHPYLDSSSSLLSQMSGEHRDHIVEKDAVCADCHGAVVNSAGGITGGVLHVNGKPDIQVSGMTYNDGRCTGSCHGEGHSGDQWLED